ncbi:MAG: [FeFe] hydrogenase, group A [Bifidobacteriaceae bacterium]|jgi:iron-only hydrogenase group A|nr:[FeFe] hydrogenase, group A [Bifidobacteriaceae bacterium]
MNIVINGVDFKISDEDKNLSLLEFCYKNQIEILALCYLLCGVNSGKCGLCRVEITQNDGTSNDRISKIKPACLVSLEDGLNVVTDSQKLKDMQTKAVVKLLEKHDFSCAQCYRKTNCEFLNIVQKTRAKTANPYKADPAKIYSGPTLTIDSNKCVLCARCVSTCAAKTRTKSVEISQTDFGRAVRPAGDSGFEASNCLLCGQCVASCPVAALQETSHIAKVARALENNSLHTVAAIAPAVRTALGELFRLPRGTDVTAKIYTALRTLGFKSVFDLNFAADLTIMEEAAELVERIRNKGPFPLFTSCCPAWIRQVENYFPELKPNVSTVKSPQQIYGASAKSYFSEKNKIAKENIFTVSIVPCTAKKFEADRAGMVNDNVRNIDAVLTTRELAELLGRQKIRLPKLEDGSADKLMGEYSGAGGLFGVTGGVMEAAIRTAKDTLTGLNEPVIDYCAIRGFKGIKESEVKIGQTVLKIAVVDGAANLFDFVESGQIKNYHFIEVMACEAGCIGGGGQPHISAKDQLLGDWKKQRASVLYSQDEKSIIRKCHENPEIKLIYSSFFEKPLSAKAHKYLHYEYK